MIAARNPVSAKPDAPPALPCHWGGGNDVIWCSTCGAEYAYAKGEARPACPRAAEDAPPIADRDTVPAEPEVILYTNHRGKTAVRRIRLDVIAHGNEAVGFGFGSTEWHPGEQLLFSAFDVDKGARRTFAMAGVKAWGKEAVAAALASSSGEALRAIRFATKYIDDHWDRAEFFEAFLRGDLSEWPEFTSSAPPVVAAETFATIAAWAEATFGPITPERTVARADEEMAELRAEPASVEEAADVVICLARYANLWAAVERKMAVNRKRQWRRVGDGTGYHIKAAAV